VTSFSKLSLFEVKKAAVSQSVPMDLIAKVAGRTEEIAKGLQPAHKPRRLKPPRKMPRS
jgi:hypothetical protein